MVSFRRIILALTVLALFVGLANAQVGSITGGAPGAPAGALQCSATVAVPPQLRSEGITEQIGDIVLTCTGGQTPAPGSQVGTANITVSLATPVTSRIIGTGNASEALLLIDEPGSGLTGPGPALAQIPCTSAAFGAGPGGCGPTWYSSTQPPPGYPVTTQAGTTAAPNVYQGIVASNQVTFYGVPVLPPTTAGLTRVYRITNLRANVNGIGGAGLPGTTPLQASVAISGSTSLPINNPVITAGFIQSGLSTSVRSETNGTSTSGSNYALNLLQCNSSNTGSKFGTQNATLRFSENFGTAFKTRLAATSSSTGLGGIGGAFPGLPYQNVPGTIYNSESGFIFPINGGTQPAGLSDYGTRLRAVFSGIPAGVSLYVTTTNFQLFSNGTATNGNTYTNNQTVPGQVPISVGNLATVAVMVQSETAPDFGNTVPLVNYSNLINSGNIALAPVNLVNGAGEAVWEVVQANPNTLESVDFGIYFQYTANPGAAGGGTPPTTGSTPGKVNMSFAAFSTASGATSGPVPRFADLSGSGNSIIAIGICQTELMFPWVTNEAGFETGLAIANMSTDPYSSNVNNQAGTCVISFYGDNPVATTITAPCTTAGYCTGTVPTGKTTAATVSTMTGGAQFQGYALALCNFQYAHGFAFISDTHTLNFATVYLALVANNGTNITNRVGPSEQNVH